MGKVGATRLRRAAPLAAATGIGALVGVLSPGVAQAHFYLVSPTNWVTSSTASGAPEKLAPCGNEAATAPDGAPTGVITALSSNPDGTTSVTITINEVVHHAGWYRVSLAPGRASTQTATTLPDPPTPPTSCAATIETTPTLPVVADDVFRHTAAFTAPQTVQVKLPAGVTCTHASPCTLQVVEVMDDGGHFPPGCFYHHCADISVGPGADGGSNTSGSVGDASASPEASSGSSGSRASSGSGGSSGSPGSSGSSSASGSTDADASSGVGAASGNASGATSGAAISGGSGQVAVVDGAAGSGASVMDGGTAMGAPNDGGGGCGLAGRSSPGFAILGGLTALSMGMRRRRRGRGASPRS